MNVSRVEVSSHRTDWVVTNDPAQNATQDIQKVCALRWKIEQFHSEIKQVTGIEKCQCRKDRCQRNHIVSAVLVWIRLTHIARKTSTTYSAITCDMSCAAGFDSFYISPIKNLFRALKTKRSSTVGILTTLTAVTGHRSPLLPASLQTLQSRTTSAKCTPRKHTTEEIQPCP